MDFFWISFETQPPFSKDRKSNTNPQQNGVFIFALKSTSISDEICDSWKTVPQKKALLDCFDFLGLLREAIS